MKVRSRVLALFLCLVLAFCLVVPVRAAGLALSAAEIFGSMWSVYASSVGISQSMKSGGELSSLGNPFNGDNYNNVNSSLFSQYMNSIGSNQTITEWASWAVNQMSVGASSGYGTVFQMSSSLIEFFDAYGTYVLENVVGLTKNAQGLFSAADTWFYNNLASIPASHLYLPTIDHKPSKSELMSHGRYFRYLYGNNYYQIASASDPGVIFCTVGPDYNNTYICRSSATAWTVSSGSNSVNTINISNAAGGCYWGVSKSGTSGMIDGVPHFATNADAAAYYLGYQETDGGTIQVKPKEGVTDVLGIPDVTNPDYAPDAITGTLGYPYALAGVDALPDVLAWVKDKVLGNVDVLDNSIPADPAAEAAMSNDPDQYLSVGLSDVFPFCLPFDLYSFFECLAADPVAPSFEVPIEFPPLDLTYTFEIDLSEFNDVAALLRKLELLGFCVALILITRQKMIRG